MNDYALGEFLSAVFLPSVPAIAGGVIAFTLALLVYVAFRDGLIKDISP